MWFYRLALAVVLFVLLGLWRKIRKIQQRLTALEGADAHFCQGDFPIDVKMLERLQHKVGEFFTQEGCEDWQGKFVLWTEVSKLINYWLALHPSEIRDGIDKAQQAGGQQVISHMAKGATIAHVARMEDAAHKEFVFTIDAGFVATVNDIRPGTFPEVGDQKIRLG